MTAKTLSFAITAQDRASPVFAKLNASIERMTRPSRDLQATMSKFGQGSGLASLGGGLARVAGAAAGAATRIASMVPAISALTGAGSIAGIAALTNSFARTAVTLDNTAKALGMGSKELQEFELAGRMVGIAAGQTSSSLEGLANTIEDAATNRSPEAAENLRQLGVQIKYLNGSVDVVGTMKQLADVIAKLPNAQAQQAVSSAFGIREMLPLLRTGSMGIGGMIAEVQRLGLTMTEAEKEAGKKYGRLLWELNARTDRFQTTLGNALLPSVIKVTEAVNRLVGEYGGFISSKVGEFSERLAKWIGDTNWAEVGRTFDGIGRGLVSAMPAVNKLIDLMDRAKAFADADAPKFEPAHPIDSAKRMGDFYGGGPWQRNSERDAAKEKARKAQLPPEGERVDKAMQFFQSRGWNPQQASGIVANLYAESALDPGAVGDGGKAKGIGQWHPKRRLSFFGLTGKSMEDATMAEQMAFVDWELRNSERPAGDRLRKAKTAAEAGDIVSRDYERPGAVEEAARNRSRMAANLYATEGDPGARSQLAKGGGQSEVTVRFENPPPGMRVSSKSSGGARTKVSVGSTEGSLAGVPF